MQFVTLTVMPVLVFALLEWVGHGPEAFREGFLVWLWKNAPWLLASSLLAFIIYAVIS